MVEERYTKTLNFTMILLKAGFAIFSPIAYFHPFAQAGGLPTDALYWHNFNMAFLRKSEAIFVLRLTGWDQSKGVQIETGIAKQLDIPRVDYSADFQRIQ